MHYLLKISMYVPPTITILSTHARRNPWFRSLRGEGVRGPQGPLPYLVLWLLFKATVY